METKIAPKTSRQNVTSNVDIGNARRTSKEELEKVNAPIASNKMLRSSIEQDFNDAILFLDQLDAGLPLPGEILSPEDGTFCAHTLRTLVSCNNTTVAYAKTASHTSL